jgi:hypothetical protein
MYRKEDRMQLSLEEFRMPFGGKLSADNRWVQIAKLMPWELVEDLYAAAFKDENPDGRPPIAARIAFGAIYIKEQENYTDVRTVENIAENPYMQYFLGLKEFRQAPLFDASMMVHFRKRFSREAIEMINEELYRRMNPPKPPDGGGNDGTLMLDATAAPADVRYPTDLSLLNECRENTEKMIDEIWQYTERKGHKTAYNRRLARKEYLRVAKQRKPRKKKLKQAIRKQLDCVEKNLETLQRLMSESGAVLSEQQNTRLNTSAKQQGNNEKCLTTQHIHVPIGSSAFVSPMSARLCAARREARQSLGKNLQYPL